MTKKKLSKTKIKAIMARCKGVAGITNDEIRKLGLDPNLVYGELYQAYLAERGMISLVVPGISYPINESTDFRTVHLLNWLARHVGADISFSIPDTETETQTETKRRADSLVKAIQATLETEPKTIPV